MPFTRIKPGSLCADDVECNRFAGIAALRRELSVEQESRTMAEEERDRLKAEDAKAKTALRAAPGESLIAAAQRQMLASDIFEQNSDDAAQLERALEEASAQLLKEMATAQQKIDRLQRDLGHIRDLTGVVKHKTAEECEGCGCFVATAGECVGILVEEGERLAAENAKLRARDAEWWRAANRLNNATNDVDECAAQDELREIAIGNAWADMPASVQELLVKERDRLAFDNADLRQQIEGHAARIADQSELLSRRAEVPAKCAALEALLRRLLAAHRGEDDVFEVAQEAEKLLEGQSHA